MPGAVVARLHADLADLDKRRQNVLDQIEEDESTGDEEIDGDLGSRLRDRYVRIARDHQAKTEQLAALTRRQEGPPDDPTLLDELPTIGATVLADLPGQLLRDLYDSFNLELRYQAASHSVVVRVTVRADRIPEIRTAIDQAAAPQGPPVPLFVAPPTGFEPVSPP